ncbi:1-phosphatidylinositol phosphodiesterase-like [Pygocentrus nattereri]|uniref:1-phosphatidylinositol phosphodiesterase-like n=1 Tax=Pygocentrus nattereri TaxID=42514 RepID=UPI0018915115|nr:1-phosphatidylinositol phosphodiesterase-like [Pygocentrus nattereri]
MMKNPRAELVLGLSSLILVLQGKTNGQGQTFNDGGKLQLPENYKIDWMKSLNDNKLLSEITLPGTHDTMALYGGPAAECQAWSLEDQLKAGIRYLDLRAFAFEDKLYLMHGIVYEHSTFTKAMDTIKSFLSAYPSETVLVRVKPDLFDKSKVEGLVEKATANDPNIWVLSTMPTLGKVRGMVVFIQKDSFTLGLPLNETDTKGDYEVVHIRHKEEEIVLNLNKALNECGTASIVLTYSSGTGIGTFEGMFLTPKRVAEKIDPWLYSYLQLLYNNVPNLCFGVIAMDFPGLDLIQTVIDFNNS